MAIDCSNGGDCEGRLLVGPWEIRKNNLLGKIKRRARRGLNVSKERYSISLNLRGMNNIRLNQFGSATTLGKSNPFHKVNFAKALGRVTYRY